MRTPFVVAILSAATFASAQVPEGKWAGPGKLQAGSEPTCGGDANYELTITGKDITGRASATQAASSLQGTVLSNTDLAISMKEWQFMGIPAKFENGQITFLQSGRRCKYLAVLKPVQDAK
jgi:hypothetical protein